MVLVGSGFIISGTAINEGKITAVSGELKLTDVKESWYPNPTKKGQKEAFKDKSISSSVYSYEFEENGNKLRIHDLELSSSEPYYRVVKNQ